MNAPRWFKASLIACVVAAPLCSAAGSAASQDPATVQPTNPAAQVQRPAPPGGLTASERSLVEGSRGAIVETGVSADYFDRHFRVARVFDRPGDRRVVWTFSVGGHEATVSDSVGFYTEGGRRFDTHSVAGTLNSTSDIKTVITRRRAESVMRRCIGRFTNAQVEYRAHGPEGHAALLLTAEAVVAPRAAVVREARERRERQERERRERASEQSQGSEHRGDEIEKEDEGGDRPAVIFGVVDLSTGRCTVGRGQAGPPVASPTRARGRVR